MSWLDDAVALNPQPIPVELPERFKGAYLKDIEVEDLKVAARDYLHNFWDEAPKGIAPVFIGRSGLYKTFAAAAIADPVSRFVETLWVNCPEDIARLEFNKFDKETIRTIDRWSKVPFLVMDDFAFGKAFGADIIRIISSARFAGMRPTLWTGNVPLDFDKIAAVYGAMFSRRLQDGGTGYTVSLE